MSAWRSGKRAASRAKRSPSNLCETEIASLVEVASRARREEVDSTKAIVTQPSFVPVVLRTVASSAREDSGVEILANRGQVIRVNRNFDEETFLRVVALR